jgi:peptidoglycan/xylan/chitin deacetylase (PgdA/CDA1 family)
MTYSPSYYQPSLLELARGGNFRAIAYWMNSILSPQGIHIQTDSTQAGCLKVMVNFNTNDPEACMEARRQLVRHICYRLWTLNSAEIREVRIMGRMTGHRQVLWRQKVRINTPASARAYPVYRSNSRVAHPAGHDRFRLLRSLLLNRFTLIGFIFCYWIFYLETTGHQKANQASQPSTPAQEVVHSGQGQAQQDPAQSNTNAPAPPASSQIKTFAVPTQFQGQVISEATPPAGEKVVALTFDDGPWENTSEQILEILRQNNIKATFYLVGQAIQANPEIAKKIADDGHALGNHTWRHIMDDMDQATAVEELSNNAKLIYQATGTRTYLMRPPGGNMSGSLVEYAKQRGYMVTMWSADSHDYMVSAPLIIDNVLSQVKPGGIVLMHDGGGDRAPTVEALPQIISSLQRQGYKFVTVPELMEMQAKWGPIQPSAANPSEMRIARIPQTFQATPMPQEKK